MAAGDTVIETLAWEGRQYCISCSSRKPVPYRTMALPSPLCWLWLWLARQKQQHGPANGSAAEREDRAAGLIPSRSTAFEDATARSTTREESKFAHVFARVYDDHPSIR